MKRYIYILIWLLSPILVQAQNNIVQAEYWFDGQYSTAVSSNVVSGSTLNLNANIDVSGLEDGLHMLTYRFKDSRGVWGSVLTEFFSLSSESGTPIAHSIISHEYWFDGNYNTVQKGNANGTSFNLLTNLDVSAIENGLHTVSHRFKDDRGIWSAPITEFFSKDNYQTGIRKIVKYEYWLNNDYSGKKVETISSTTSLNIAENLDVSTIAVGIHTLHYRFQDDAGRWCAPRSWMFHNYRDEDSSEMHEIVAMEYWFNDDYSGAARSPILASEVFNIDDKVDVSSLGEGLHYISCRFLDDAGNWSSAESRFFSTYSKAEASELRKIVFMEYWFDGDMSSSHKDAVTPSSNLIIDTKEDISSLGEGLHTISSRYKDEAGNWSSVETRFFSTYAAPQSPEMNKIVGYEYWIDDDRSSMINVAVPETEVLLIDATMDVSSLDEGLHIISCRIKDEAGNWSSTESRFFSYYNDEILPADNKIVGYRYWADEAISSAKEVTLKTPVKSLVLDELIDVAHFPSGEHMANFQFVDAQGQWSSALSQTYTKPVQPFVEISADDSAVCLGTAVHFDAEIIDADVIEWKFGDGNTSSEAAPQHTYLAAGTYEVTATVTHTDSAKSAHDTIIGGITIYPKYNLTVDLEVCGSSLPYQFGSQSLSTAGTYVETFTSAKGCDSTVSLNFSIVPVLLTTLQEGICPGECFLFDSELLTEAGTYRDTTLSAGGCDSITILELSVNPRYETPVSVEICNGDTYAFDGKLLSKAGTYKDSLLSVDGCDSVVVLTLSVNPTYVTNIQDSICQFDAYDFGDKQLYGPGTYRDTLKTAAGCDSIIELELWQHRAYETNLDTTICEGESVYFNGKLLSVEGNYKDTLPTVYGCDSILEMILLVKPVYDDTLNITLCEGESYWFDGVERTTSGIYQQSYQSEFSCDSMVTLFLNVLPGSASAAEIEICEGEKYSFGDDLLDQSGVYKDTLQSAVGCDSIVTLTLTVNPTYETNLNAAICEGDVYTFDGKDLKTSGIYRDSLLTEAGCDSILILDLAVNPVRETVIDSSICIGESVVFAGETLSKQGIYKDTLQSSLACDSILVLNLVVNDTFNVDDNVIVCETDLPFNFGDQQLSKDGIYTEIFTSAYGCDSIVKLTFSVLDSSLSSHTHSLCDSELPYVFGTQSLTGSGVYTETFTAANGCDSTVVLNLQVYPSYSTSKQVVLKDNEFPYTFAGKQYAGPGTYRIADLSINGCDSITTLVLKRWDNTAPSIKCNSIDVWLNDAGTYNLTTADVAKIAEGTTDDKAKFSDLDLQVSPSSFNCDDLGAVTVTLRATDEAGNSSTCSTQLTIQKSNQVPTLDAIEDVIVGEDSTVSIALSGISGGDDCIAQEVTVSASTDNAGLISSCLVDYTAFESNGLLTIVPLENKVGDAKITVKVVDSDGAEFAEEFTVKINEVNDPPVVRNTPPSHEWNRGDGDSLRFIFDKKNNDLFEDIDGDTLFYSITVKKHEQTEENSVGENLNVSSDTLVLPAGVGIVEMLDHIYVNFDPAIIDTGCYEVTITASDQHGSSASVSFDICISGNLTGANDFEAPVFDVLLYPNPTKGLVTIDMVSEAEEVEVLVMNIAGAEILRKQYRTSDLIRIDLSEEVSGIYLIRIKSGENSTVKKLILDRK